MFTGIIETSGIIKTIEKNGSNIDFVIESSISSELKIDQSVSHNGVCLTVIEINENTHRITAIDETLQKTNLNALKKGDAVNLERAMPVDGRLDGHLVQGHVDTTAAIISIKDENGSWLFTFQYQPSKEFLLVNKGSICIDGVSLTVVNPTENTFNVAIIPYTFQHTVFQHYTTGSIVNIEFDIIGKYFSRYFELYNNNVNKGNG
jgi:riboflavin synthase